MPKPYPNYFSNSSPGRLRVTVEYQHRSLGASFSDTTVPMQADQVWLSSGSRDSGSSPGYPTQLQSNLYSYTNYERRMFYGYEIEERMPWNTAGYLKHVTKRFGDFGDTSILGYTYLTVASVIKLNLANRLRGQLSDKVRNQVAGWAENVSQHQKMIDMIGSRVGQLGRLAAAVRRGDGAAARRVLGLPEQGPTRSRARRRRPDVAGAWLEMQYGWLPLLSDIYETAMILDRLVSNKPPRGRAVVSDSFADSKTVSVPKSDYFETAHYTCRVDIKYVVTFSSASTSLRTMKELGLTNPILLAWELLPYSFVVDWLAPISSFLGQLDVGFGVNFLDGCETQFEELRVDVQRTASGIVVGDRKYTSDKRAMKRNISVKRTRLTSWPRALLPGLKSPYSVNHAINGIALLSQHLKR